MEVHHVEACQDCGHVSGMERCAPSMWACMAPKTGGRGAHTPWHDSAGPSNYLDEYSARKRFFCTLPIAFLGSVGTKCTRFGTLKPAMSSLSAVTMLASVISHPARGTTMAVTASPN